MAVDKKISQLASGAPAQAGDEYVVARSGANFKLTLTNIAASMPPIGATTPNTGSFTSLTNSGNLTFSSTGQRITGDFSNATQSNRLAFQTSTTNGATDIYAIPNGTGSTGAFTAVNASDPNNASTAILGAFSDSVRLYSNRNGTGTFYPMTFYTGGSERMRLDTSGLLGLGNTVASTINAANGVGNLVVGSGSGSEGITIYTGTADTGGIAFADGTTTTDTYRGYINYAHATDHMAFWTSATERMRIDSSGNVGIGTASPVAKLQSAGTSGSAQFRAGTASNGYFEVNAFDSSPVYCVVGGSNATAGVFGTQSNIPTIFFSNNTERMRITSGGNVNIGTTTDVARLHVSRSDNDVSARVANSLSTGLATDMFQVIALNHAAGTGFYFHRCYSSSATVQFAVRGDGTIYAQNTTVQSLSDARVKENVRTATEGLAVIDALRPVRFDFKKGFGNNRKNQLGFVAQEVEAVFPDAVDVMGDKDENGDSYKSVGPAALIPVLVKAIQELSAKVAALEAK